MSEWELIKDATMKFDLATWRLWVDGIWIVVAVYGGQVISITLKDDPEKSWELK